MRTVIVKGTIDTSAGSYLWTHKVGDNRPGMKKSLWPFARRNRKDLFVGTREFPRIIAGKQVYEPLELLEPVGSYMISQFKQPREILVIDQED
jgi:hypothetical protein